MNRERFGKYLHDRRVELNLSRRQLAGEIGAGVDSIKAYELGKNAPEVDRLLKLAGILEVNLEVLYNELEEPMPEQLGDKTDKYIPLPDNFPKEAQEQVERFAKFLQYEKEFDQFLALSGYFGSEADLQESLDAFVRKTQTDFSMTGQDKGERKSRVS